MASLLNHSSRGFRRRKRPTTIRAKDIISIGKKQRVVGSEFPLLRASVSGSGGVLDDSLEQPVADTFGHEQDPNNPMDMEDYQLPYHKPRQSYEERQQNLSDSWEKVRNCQFMAYVDSSVPPNGWICDCGCPALVRCHSCGPFACYCCDCAVRLHQYVNVYHMLEIWKDGMFMPYIVPNRQLSRYDHSCSSSYLKSIACLDGFGNQHNLSIVFCRCEPEAVTLIRLHLWPATPVSPVQAFHFELLDWLEALLLECQVAVGDFVRAFKLRRPWYAILFQSLDMNVYPAIIDSFEEYRYFKYRTRYLTDFCPSFDKGNTCLACPNGKRGGGDLFESFDALFGLSRKKSSGKSVRDPLHRNLMFSDQVAVDQFVANYKQNSSATGCNEFLAGHPLKSAGRYSALDETAIFGRACRHEFPKRFINLKHGERISYSVWLLKEMKESVQYARIHLLYDIACMLEKHLRASGNSELLDGVQIAIPIFHVYGHQAKCQIMYSPRLKDGFGLTDGEVMERLWSKLRRYARMTKEMRPSHRVDVLTDVFLHLGREANINLATLLPSRRHRGMATLKESKKQVLSLLSSLGENNTEVTDDVISQWCSERQDSFSLQRTLKSILKLPKWKEDYCDLVEIQSKIRYDMQQPNCNNIPHLVLKLTAVERSMDTLEKDYKIRPRWTDTSVDFKAVHVASRRIKQSLMLEKISTKSQERFFLLDVKAKYASGHKLSQKLSKQITVITGNLKVLLRRFNESEWEELPRIITIQEVCSREMTWSWTSQASSSSIPVSVKNQLIDAWNLQKRAMEEMTLLTEEMNRVISNSIVEVEEVNNLVQYDAQNLSSGAICLCKQLLVRKVAYHLLYQKKFCEVVSQMPTLPKFADDLIESCLEQVYVPCHVRPIDTTSQPVPMNVTGVLGSISEESEDVVTGVAKLDIVSDNIIGSQGLETTSEESEAGDSENSIMERGLSTSEEEDVLEDISREVDVLEDASRRECVSTSVGDIMSDSEGEEDLSEILKAKAIRRFELDQWRLYDKDEETAQNMVTAMARSEGVETVLQAKPQCQGQGAALPSSPPQPSSPRRANIQNHSSYLSRLREDAGGLRKALEYAQAPPRKHSQPFVFSVKHTANCNDE